MWYNYIVGNILLLLLLIVRSKQMGTTILISGIVGFLAYPVLFHLCPKLLSMLKKTSKDW